MRINIKSDYVLLLYIIYMFSLQAYNFVSLNTFLTLITEFQEFEVAACIDFLSTDLQR